MGGVVTASEEGTPQGGPLSPMLANIYLDGLDKELDERGHSYCRYADDRNIYVGSQAAAERTLTSIRDWIDEEGLGTKVSGLSTEPQTANRDSTGKRETIQSESARIVAKLPEQNQ